MNTTTGETMSVADQMDQLLALQRIDSAIRGLEKALALLPEQLSQAQEEEDGIKAQAEEGEARVAAVLKRRKELEGEIESIGQQIVTFENQKLNVKTNEEFRAINAQIEHAKQRRSAIEDDVLASYDDEESAREKSEQFKVKLEAAAQRTAERKKELEVRSGSDKKRLEELRQSRERVAPAIEARTLARYEIVRERKSGVAVAGVSSGNCGGCFSALPPQLVNEVKARKTLKSCEYCGRFLVYDPDEA